MKKLPMFSLVVFCGDCELKDVSFIPQGCYLASGRMAVLAVDDIISANSSANYSDKWEVVRLLQKAVSDGGDQSLQAQHITYIQDMLGTNKRYE